MTKPAEATSPTVVTAARGASVPRQPEPAPRTVPDKNVGLHRVALRDLVELMNELGTTPGGLVHDEAARRLAQGGPNEVAHEAPPPWYAQLFTAFKNPFIVVLVGLAVIERVSSPEDLKGPTIIGVMVTISVGIRFWQEFRSSRAATLSAVVDLGIEYRASFGHLTTGPLRVRDGRPRALASMDSARRRR